MRKRMLIPLLILLLLLCGCSEKPYPGLPETPIAFELGHFEDTEHDAAWFGTLEYNGRTYIAFGTTSNGFRRDDVDQCVGYIVQDENSTSVPDPDNKNWRVYTLAGDADHNFLMDYDASASMMNQPSLWRAMDTKGKAIEIPKYISSFEYDYWK